MNERIYLPLRHEPGEYAVGMLNGSDGIAFRRGDFDMLDLEIDGSEQTFYNVSDEVLDTLTAVYGDDWQLKKAELTFGYGKVTAYINFADDSAAWTAVREFANAQGKLLADKISQCGKKVKRAFLESHIERDSFDFGVIIASEEEYTDAVNRSGASAAEMSGEYDHDGKIAVSRADSRSFGTMLFCMPSKLVNGLTTMAVEIMTEYVYSACDGLEKADDYKFVGEEYD